MNGYSKVVNQFAQFSSNSNLSDEAYCILFQLCFTLFSFTVSTGGVIVVDKYINKHLNLLTVSFRPI